MEASYTNVAEDRPTRARRGKMHAAPRKELLNYLPAIYQERDDGQESKFVGRLLTPFENILLGSGEQGTSKSGEEELARGLEEEVAELPKLFDPWETPKEFLPWLASWVGLSFRPELSEDRRRKLLANIVPLYRIRGTRRYLEELLQLCVDAFATVSDAEIPGLQVGEYSTVGVDAYIEGGPPHFFLVTLVAPKLAQEEKEKQVAIAHSVIERAKPAHTFYELSVTAPRWKLGTHSRVGIDTVVGSSES